MTDEELKNTIQALETANKQYNKNYYDNEHLIRKYQWKLWYADIHKKQMEIINQALYKDVFVFIFGTGRTIEERNSRFYEEPRIKGFTLNTVPDEIWIAKLKSEEFKPFDNGYPIEQFLVGLTDCYFISRSHRTDEGKFRVGYKPHDNWGVFSVISHRINIFNRHNFKDKEVLDYLKQLTNIAI